MYTHTHTKHKMMMEVCQKDRKEELLGLAEWLKL
jgi:hypothetical protein